MLLPGRTYEVLGCATGGVTDLDLVLVDGAGAIVAVDTSTGVEPVLDLTGRTGTYTLVLYARKTQAPGTGGIAAAVLHR